MRYHGQGQRVATPAYAGQFRLAVVTAARAAATSPDCTTADHQMIRDVISKDARYQFKTVDRILDLLATLDDDAPALGFVEELHGAILARRHRNAARDLQADLLAETSAQGAADVAVMRVLVAPHPDLRLVQDAIDATVTHKRGVERLLDDLFGQRFHLAHGGR